MHALVLMPGAGCKEVKLHACCGPVKGGIGVASDADSNPFVP